MCVCVSQVKEVLERFLEDDEDMHKLNLTAQELYRQAMLQELTAQGVSGHIHTHTCLRTHALLCGKPWDVCVVLCALGAV